MEIEEADVFYVEPRPNRRGPGLRRRFRTLIPYLATALVAALATFGVVKVITPEHFGLKFTLLAVNGKVALTQKQLHDIVVGEGLTVYWLGPEDGALYALTSVNSGQNYVRYLPGGEGLADSGANFRVVGTYEAKDAFSVTQNEAKAANSVGFVNSEANAVYYNTARPLSVYVGLRNSDDQIEIFNPTAGQALIEAKTPGLVTRIK